MSTEEFQDGEFKIIRGPSKFDLMTSLFSQSPWVEFSVAGEDWPARVHLAEIHGVERDNRNNNCEDWIVSMTISEIDHNGKINKETTVKTKAQYSTKIRKGVFRKFK